MDIGDAVFVFTRQYSLMAGCLIDIGGTGSQWIYSVINHRGGVYQCKSEIVFEHAAGLELMRETIGRQMAADGYQVAPFKGESFRIYQPTRHGLYGGWVVSKQVCEVAKVVEVCDDSTSSTSKTSRASKTFLRCNCPAYRRHGYCKHALAVHTLINMRADRQRAKRCFDRANRLQAIATELRALPVCA